MAFYDPDSNQHSDGRDSEVSLTPKRKKNPPNAALAFIVIEMHGGPEYAAIVTDSEGNNKVFYTREEADAEAADCQQGIVVPV